MADLKTLTSKDKDDILKQPVPELVDPDNNVDSELTPADLKNPPEPNDEDTVPYKINLIKDRVKNCTVMRLVHERNWLDSWNLYRGGNLAWLKWNSALNQYQGINGFTMDNDGGEEEARRVYSSRNLVKPLTKSIQARALQCKPIVTAAPSTDSIRDKSAAAEARAFLSHMNRIQDRQSQLEEITQYSLISGPPLLKIWWDSKAYAEIPDYENGEFIGSSRGPVGEIIEDIVNCMEMYYDPKAKRLEECAYVIHAKVVALDEVQKRYGNTFLKNGWAVTPDASYDETGVEVRMAMITGDLLRWSEQKKNAVRLFECWEKPSMRYPNGRILVVGNNILLRDDPWPDFLATLNRYPFVPLYYEKSVGTCYGQNLVTDLIDPQRSYNSYISRLEEHRNEATLKVLWATGSEVGTDTFKGDRLLEGIQFNPVQGAPPPMYLATPPPSNELYEGLKIEEQLMQTIAGVRDVSQGGVPTGVTAAQAINLLQQADMSQTASFLVNLLNYTKKVAELELAFAATYYSEPRLVGLDDIADNPEVAQMKVQTFDALAAGGSCKIVLIPGSELAETPMAKTERIQAEYNSGRLGIPGSPESTKAYYQLMGTAMPDQLEELLEKSWERAQQNPQAAIQAQTSQQQAMQTQQAALQAKQADLQQKSQLKQQEYQLRIQQGEEDRKHQAEVLAITHKFKMDESQQAHQQELEKIQAQNAAIGIPKVNVSLSAPLDENGQISAERAAGLTPGGQEKQ